MASTIWTEKYRPQNFEEIKGQERIVSKVKALVEQRNLPHLMFVGPAGVGKSTLSLVVAKQLFGDQWRENFLELNASDERGIDVVRNTVKDFARVKSLSNFPFKIIFLDECDALTKEAQQALRRTMEKYAQSTRFILSANYSSKLIDPIQSRCAVFKFQPLGKEFITEIIKKIAAEEGLVISSEVEDALYEVSHGDCRRLENIMQSCAAMGKELTPDLVFSMASVAKPKEVKQVLEMALEQKFEEARKALTDVMFKYGLAGIDVIKQIQQEIWGLPLSDRAKVEMIDKCGEIEFRLVEGSDEFVQLEALLAQFVLVGSK